MEKLHIYHPGSYIPPVVSKITKIYKKPVVPQYFERIKIRI